MDIVKNVHIISSILGYVKGYRLTAFIFVEGCWDTSWIVGIYAELVSLLGYSVYDIYAVDREFNITLWNGLSSKQNNLELWEGRNEGERALEFGVEGLNIAVRIGIESEYPWEYGIATDCEDDCRGGIETIGDGEVKDNFSRFWSLVGGSRNHFILIEDVWGHTIDVDCILIKWASPEINILRDESKSLCGSYSIWGWYGGEGSWREVDGVIRIDVEVKEFLIVETNSIEVEWTEETILIYRRTSYQHSILDTVYTSLTLLSLIIHLLECTLLHEVVLGAELVGPVCVGCHIVETEGLCTTCCLIAVYIHILLNICVTHGRLHWEVR
jgi:hypothetical protein